MTFHNVRQRKPVAAVLLAAPSCALFTAFNIMSLQKCHQLTLGRAAGWTQRKGMEVSPLQMRVHDSLVLPKGYLIHTS